MPTDGCYPLVPEMDHVGPMARTMADCALAYQALSGPRAAAAAAARGCTSGLLHPIADGGRLEAAGAHVEEAELPQCDVVLPYFAAICAATHRDLLARDPEGYSDDLRRKLESGWKVQGGGLPRLPGREGGVAAHLRGGAALRRAGRARRSRASCRAPTSPRRPSCGIEVTYLTRPFNALGWPAATTRDGTMFTGRSERLVLGAALAWEEGLPPVAIA